MRIERRIRVWAFAHMNAGSRIGARRNVGYYAFMEVGALLDNDDMVKDGAQIWEGV